MYGKVVRSTVLTHLKSISQYHHIIAQLQHEFITDCALRFGFEREKGLLMAGSAELDSSVDIENKICTNSQGKNLFKMTARRRLLSRLDSSDVVHQLSWLLQRTNSSRRYEFLITSRNQFYLSITAMLSTTSGAGITAISATSTAVATTALRSNRR